MIFIISVILYFVILKDCSSQPSISGVFGEMKDGETITITGSTFGSNGPNVVLFDDFNRGTTGDPISLDAKHGNWTSIETPTRPPTYDSDAHSGMHSYRMYKPGEGNCEFRKILGSDVTEFFVSFWYVFTHLATTHSYRYKVPTGTRMPAAPSPGVFPPYPGTYMSHQWLRFCDGIKSDNNDYWAWQFSWTFRWAGDSPDFSCYATFLYGSWNWNGDWIRMQFWMKAPPGAPLTDGQLKGYHTNGLSSFGTQISTRNTHTFFDSSKSPPYQWNNLYVSSEAEPNWSNTRPLMDDIYVAVGANSRARIEMGDKSTYSSCTNLALLTPLTWGNTYITATMNLGAFYLNDTAYIFVFDINGNVNSPGYEIMINDPNALPPPPPPPDMKWVQDLIVASLIIGGILGFALLLVVAIVIVFIVVRKRDGFKDMELHNLKTSSPKNQYNRMKPQKPTKPVPNQRNRPNFNRYAPKSKNNKPARPKYRPAL